MSPLPPWYPWPETETKPAPMPLLLVQAFVNTIDLSEGQDLLADDERAARWLASAGLLAANESISEDELALTLAVRASLRELLASGATDVRPLREAAAARTPTLTVADDGGVALRAPEEGDAAGALVRLLLIVRAAQENGSWQRLRICANDECRWAFYDRSRNQHGHWCDMATCGNKLKNREFRARRRS